MKKLLKKIIQSSTVILISWIVAYGIVYAQPACCSNIIDTRIPFLTIISNIIDSHSKPSPSHHRNHRLQPIHCSENFLVDCDAKNACCKTDRCDRYNQGTYFNPSFPQNAAHPLQKNVSSFHVSDGEQRAFETYSLSTSLKAVPIYILTKSIII